MMLNLSEKTRRDLETIADICAIAIGVFVILYLLGIVNRQP